MNKRKRIRALAREAINIKQASLRWVVQPGGVSVPEFGLSMREAVNRACYCVPILKKDSGRCATRYGFIDPCQRYYTYCQCGFKDEVLARCRTIGRQMETEISTWVDPTAQNWAKGDEQ